MVYQKKKSTQKQNNPQKSLYHTRLKTIINSKINIQSHFRLQKNNKAPDYIQWINLIIIKVIQPFKKIKNKYTCQK